MIINVIGFDIVRANILKEVKKVKFFAVFADEVSSNNVEHLSVCLQCIATSGEIREEIVSFIEMERVHAEDIEQAITGLFLILASTLESVF